MALLVRSTLLVRDTFDGLSPPQEIGVLQVVARGVRAAGTPEGDAGTQGPYILGDDLHVDLAVGETHRNDVGVVDVEEQTQIALGLRQPAPAVRFAALEQQLRLDRLALGAEMQVIGETV